MGKNLHHRFVKEADARQHLAKRTHHGKSIFANCYWLEFNGVITP
jgi:hypothetical protein